MKHEQLVKEYKTLLEKRLNDVEYIDELLNTIDVLRKENKTLIEKNSVLDNKVFNLTKQYEIDKEIIMDLNFAMSKLNYENKLSIKA